MALSVSEDDVVVVAGWGRTARWGAETAFVFANMVGIGGAGENLVVSEANRHWGEVISLPLAAPFYIFRIPQKPSG
jgi:hypothetical protein